MKKISVVIITRNDGRYIKHVLQSLANQNARHFEVIVVDLCSIDSTLEEIRGFPVKVIRLAADEISFAKALNIGTAQSIGEKIFCLRGRSVPNSSGFISSGMRDILRKDVAFAFGPRDILGEDSLIKIIAKNLFSLSGLPGKKELRTDEIKEANLDGCVFRKSIWLTNPFPHNSPRPLWKWAFEMINNGLKIIYDPKLRVKSTEDIGLVDFIRERKETNKSFKEFYQEISK